MASLGVLDLLALPLVAAPMGGGPTTVDLVVATGGAGALGMLAAGYKSAVAMSAEIAAVRAAMGRPFGVNVFVPGDPYPDRPAIESYLETLSGDAAAVGAALGEPRWDDDAFDDKVDALLADPVAMVGFTFGCPTEKVIDAFRSAGTVVVVTVTNGSEAQRAEAAGADALCVQGPEAGAHRGTFTNHIDATDDRRLLALIADIAAVSSLPQIAAGGIMGPAQVDEVLAAGAVAAQCGTAFLRCPESGASAEHKAALADSRYTATAVTRAFSGRPARGLVNTFMIDHPDAPAAYPEINNATRPLRAAAAAAHDAQRMSLWAGEGYRAATEQPAVKIVEDLCGHLR